MKLKTEMKTCADGMVCVSKGIDMQADREHDAAVAHALLLSIPDGSFKDSVMRDANELMAEWGFGEG